MSVKFIFSRGFVKDVKQLRKRYRLVEDDIEILLAEMEEENYRGDLVPNVGYEVYKVRLANRSARRGKSGGFRAIYHCQDEDTFMFIHIYSKSDKIDVSASELGRMLRNLP